MRHYFPEPFPLFIDRETRQWSRLFMWTIPRLNGGVAAVLERGKVRAKVLETRRKHELQAMVREHVEPKSALYTDSLMSYDGLSEEYKHQVVDHAIEYVRENVHTNGLENFWSLLKRGINGTYISVEPFHLFATLMNRRFASTTGRTKTGNR